MRKITLVVSNRIPIIQSFAFMVQWTTLSGTSTSSSKKNLMTTKTALISWGHRSLTDKPKMQYDRMIANS